MSIDSNGSSDLLAAAHDYRNRGWRVIALHRVGPDGRTCSCKKGGNCESAGKHPMNMAWQKSAPMSAADVQATWDVPRPPNLGIATGRESNLWVFDIDPKNGGMESMAALVAEHGPMPATFVTETGSGGFHYYFEYPEDIELRNTSELIGPGLDTRASGGQVVAAPSRSDVGSYSVRVDAPLGQAPAWLLEAARRPEVDPESIVTAADLPKPEDMDPAEWERLNAYSLKAIKGNLDRLDAMATAKTDHPEAYAGEPWNHTTFQVSAALIEIANSPWNAYSVGQARADVMAHAPRDRDFDSEVIGKTWASAIEKVGDKARPVPAGQASPEPDFLFDSPDVRSNVQPPGPTSAGGAAESTPAGQGDLDFLEPDDFFDKKDLQVETLGSAVRAMGPLAWGRDEDFWSFHDGVWTSDPDVMKNRCVDLLGQRYRNGHADNAATVVKRHCKTLEAEPHPRWMNFTNGMLDWETGSLVPHEPTHHSTVQFPVEYDADAVCPTFDAFLADVMHDDYVELAWEMIGYLLYSGNPLQKAFMFYGSGGNGKGTLMRVIEDLLGRQNVASESLDDLNGNRFAAVNLFGKIANLAGDIDGNYQESTANFKKLTGEDTYAGERKFGQRFTFQSWAVPVFSANKIPGSADVTEGYFRRWVVLHFHKRIANMIPGFSDLLASELPGIAAKAVRALRVLMEREAFEPKGEAVLGMEEFKMQIDQVRQWAHSGELVNKEGAWTALDLLYARYRSWAERSGQGRLKESEFSSRLHAMGFIRNAEHGAIQHRGLVPIISQAGTFTASTTGDHASEGFF